MVFDGVISSTGKHFGDLGPSVPESNMTFDDDAVFLQGPRLGFVDIWVQMIVPALTTLLSTSPGEM